MNDDQSFYEIQLNPPHLVLAVLGVVVVGVAVFYLGVVVGRDQGTPGGSPDWQAAVPVQQGDTGEGDDPMGLYDTARESDTAAPGQDEGAGETVPPPAASTQPAAEPAAPSPGGFQPADPVDEQRAPVAADTDHPAAASNTQGLPAPDAALVSGWIVQVRSTPDKASADQLQAALAVDGFPAFVMSVDVEGQTWYRVRVGRYGAKADAETVERALLRRSDVEDAWVTEG